MNNRLAGVIVVIVVGMFCAFAANADSSEKCGFAGLRLPKDFAVFAAGDYSGRELDWQIDQSGHQATQMDVVVNYQEKPLVLMLGAYEPTVWNIQWTEGTKIIGVLVGGYHRQVVAGLSSLTPLLITTNDDGNDCGYFYVGSNELRWLNPLSRRHFGCTVDKVYIAKNGEVSIGSALPEWARLETSPETPPTSYFDKDAPLAGLAGLQDAVRKGLLRKATAKDVQAWVNESIAKRRNEDVPELADEGDRYIDRPSVSETYVVVKEYTFPAGLYGGNSASFIIPKGVPFPAGNPGHSLIYDFNELSCNGPGSRNRIGRTSFWAPEALPGE